MKRRGVLSGKKGLSEIIGYVLLISMTMILSVVVYQWIKTYVPKEGIECADGVSVFVQNYSYDCDAKTFNLSVKNSGRFDIAGYFIHATKSPEQELAVTDLSTAATENGKGGAVNHWNGGFSTLNPISSGLIMNDDFNLESIGQIFKIQLVPLRYEVIDGKSRAVSCTNGKITQELVCTTGTATFCDPVCADPLVCKTTISPAQCVQCLGDGDCSIDKDCVNEQCVYVGVCGDEIINQLSEVCEKIGTSWGNCQDTTQSNPCTCVSGYIDDGPNSNGCIAAADLTLSVTTVTRQGTGNKDLLVNFRVNNVGTTNAGDSIWEAISITPDANNDPKTGSTGTINMGSVITLSTTLSYQNRPETATITLNSDSTFLISEFSEANNAVTINVDCTSLGTGSGSCTFT